MAQPPDLLHLAAAGGATGTPIVFVHGAFGAPWMWSRNFMPWFAERGHDTYALRLRGTGPISSGAVEPGLADYLEDLEAAVHQMGGPPVVVAHSLGALVAQMALGRIPMRALALLAPVPPTGMFWSSMRLALHAPSLWARTVLSATEAGFATTQATRETLFTDDASEELVREVHVNLCPQPVRPLLEAQWPRYVPRAHRLQVPLLTLAAEHDRLIPVDAVERTARHHGAHHVTVGGTGHAMMLDASWAESALAIAHWLDAHAREAA